MALKDCGNQAWSNGGQIYYDVALMDEKMDTIHFFPSL